MQSTSLKILPLALLLALSGCGLFSDKPKVTASASSSSGAHGSSSSSALFDSTRAEILYSDTLHVRDTAAFHVPDTSADSSRYNIFLGYFPKGTVLHLSLRAGSLGVGAKFRVKSEDGYPQLPTDTMPDGTYSDHVLAGASNYLTNHFALLDTAYYYLEIESPRRLDSLHHDTTVAFHASMAVDTAFYAFTGHEDGALLPPNQDYTGFFRLDNGEDSSTFHFAAGPGENITFTATGQSLEYIRLFDHSGALVDSSSRDLRRQLLPQDSTDWTVRVRSVLPSWFSGNYAFFTFRVNSIRLGKGEYLANPDTALRPGDTLSINRVGNDKSGWDVRHDEYLTLGTLNSGDSIQVWFGMQGIANVRKLVRVLDVSGAPVDTLGAGLTLNWNSQDPSTFVAPSTGTYYLHYLGLGNDNSYWVDPTYTLHLKALVQKPGSLTGWSVLPHSIALNLGDTLHLDTLQVTRLPAEASANRIELVPRAERTMLRDSLDIVFATSGAERSGDQVGSGWMKAVGAGTVHLLVRSVADPRLTDSITVLIQ